MDGTGRRVLLNNKLPHLFGISLLDNFVYWTDWSSRAIERVHKLTGDEREVIVEHLPDLMGLKVVSRAAPTGTNGCWQHNGNCSHLCLNTPDGPVCYCPIGKGAGAGAGEYCRVAVARSWWRGDLEG